MTGYNTNICSVIIGRMTGTTIEMMTGDGRTVRVKKERPPEMRALMFKQAFDSDDDVDQADRRRPASTCKTALILCACE